MNTQTFSQKFGLIFSHESMKRFAIWEASKVERIDKNTVLLGNVKLPIHFEGTIEQLVQNDLFWNNFSKKYYFPKDMIQRNQTHFEVAQMFIDFLVALYISKEKKEYLMSITPNTQILVFDEYY